MGANRTRTNYLEQHRLSKLIHLLMIYGNCLSRFEMIAQAGNDEGEIPSPFDKLRTM